MIINFKKAIPCKDNVSIGLRLKGGVRIPTGICVKANLAKVKGKACFISIGSSVMLTNRGSFLRNMLQLRLRVRMLEVNVKGQ